MHCLHFLVPVAHSAWDTHQWSRVWRRNRWWCEQVHVVSHLVPDALHARVSRLVRQRMLTDELSNTMVGGWRWRGHVVGGQVANSMHLVSPQTRTRTDHSVFWGPSVTSLKILQQSFIVQLFLSLDFLNLFIDFSNSKTKTTSCIFVILHFAK